MRQCVGDTNKENGCQGEILRSMKNVIIHGKDSVCMGSSDFGYVA